MRGRRGRTRGLRSWAARAGLTRRLAQVPPLALLRRGVWPVPGRRRPLGHRVRTGRPSQGVAHDATPHDASCRAGGAERARALRERAIWDSAGRFAALPSRRHARRMVEVTFPCLASADRPIGYCPKEVQVGVSSSGDTARRCCAAERLSDDPQVLVVAEVVIAGTLAFPPQPRRASPATASKQRLSVPTSAWPARRLTPGLPTALPPKRSMRGDGMNRRGGIGGGQGRPPLQRRNSLNWRTSEAIPRDRHCYADAGGGAFCTPSAFQGFIVRNHCSS